MANKVSFKQGEAKTLTLTIKENGIAKDVSTATLLLGVKKPKSDTTYAFSKEDAGFNKTQAAQGIVSVFLSDTDLGIAPGLYIGELKVSFPDSTIDKSADLSFMVEQAVT